MTYIQQQKRDLPSGNVPRAGGILSISEKMSKDKLISSGTLEDARFVRAWWEPR